MPEIPDTKKRRNGQLRSLPLVRNLHGYKRKDLRADARAGINVALLDFPQGMAYAMIAGLPIQFGIFSSAIGSITGPLFASSRYLMLGPTNATAVLLLSGFLAADLPPEQRIAALPLLLLMVSAILFIGALVRAEILINYVSRSVVTGYITAAALLIIINQLKYILGMEISNQGTFLGNLLETTTHLEDLRLGPLIIGVGTIATFLLINRWFKALPAVATTLVIVSVLYQLFGRDSLPVDTLPALSRGSWPLTYPAFSLDLIDSLIGTAIAIAFLSLLESASIAKTLAARSGDSVSVRQQMVSMGVANAANAFGSGMPVSGSLTRSMLNYRSGARSPLASMISGTILVIGVLAIGPWIRFIPQAALAALVILVGMSLINRDNILTFLRVSRSDAATFLTTFGCGLVFPLDTAIYIGVGLSILLFLKKVGKPLLSEYDFNERGELAQSTRPDRKQAISIVHVEGDLFFGSTDIFQDQVRALVRAPHIKVVILRLLNAYHLDASSALALRELTEFARSQGREVLLSGIRQDMRPILERARLHELIGEENLFEYTPENVTLSTRNALLRARELLGDEPTDILLFAKDRKKDS